jgi:hypothetical protein
MMPPPDLKARVLAAVAIEPAPTRSTVARGLMLAWCAAATATLAIFFALGGPHVSERPAPFVVATAAGWSTLAIAATLGVTRRRSMLGRSRVGLLVLPLALPFALLGWYAPWLSRWPLACEAPVARGLVCLVFTLSMAAAPFAVFARSRRESDPVHPRATGAAIGAMAGAWASVLIDLHCECADLLHVTVGHVLPVAVLAAVGAILGRRVIGMRADAVKAGS